jgi:hypothetical protein
MAIVVTKRPTDRCWTGNPIHYALYSAAAEAEPTNYFEIRIRMKRLDAAAFVDVIDLPYSPVDGTALVDIQDILDAMLEYELPTTPDDDEYLAPHFAKKMTALFYIQFREITELDADPDWVDTETDNQRLAVKGGISFHKWRGDNYWVNYFDIVKPFLTWELSGRPHSIAERMYLAWLNLTAVPETEIKMKRTVRFTDGSEDVSLLDCAVPFRNVVYFPSGGAQLEIEEVDVNKTVYWWELQVMKISTNPEEPLSEAFRYYKDNIPDYNGITLNYRNSIGGLNSVRIRGVIDYSLEREFSQVEKMVLHNYFEGISVAGRVAADNSTEVQVLKGDAGHMDKEQQDRLRDIHLKRECWWERQKKWMPVLLLTSSQRQKLSNDDLFSMPIEFCIASGGDKSYTPDNVNLQEGNIAGGVICTAVINNLASNYIPGTGWQITWDLASGAPVKYFVSTPGVSGGAPHETITTDYTFAWLPVGSNVITVRPVCLIGGQFYLGAAQTITVEVEAACVPVAISSSPIYLPDAVEGVAYNFVMNLTGTAPFTIDNIVKPAWMNIAIVGSTVEFTGTPDFSDAGVDIDVSFDLGNCAGAGAVSYADTIDVIEAGEYGEFTLTNESGGGNFIKNVFPNNPAFYTFTAGSLPVMGPGSATGFVIYPPVDPISVFVIIANIGHVIELYKNGILQEYIDTPASGVYSFAAVAFALGDNMEIKLKLG